MKSFGSAVAWVIFLALLSGCTGDKKKNALDAQNNLLEQFKAQQELERRRQIAMEEERETYFKNPLKPDLSGEQSFRGPANAKVTIVEYTDFQCPYCSNGARTMKELMDKYGNKLRVTVKHLPLEFHPHAMIAAQYFEAIALQSKEKAMKFHDAVFEGQTKLTAEGESFLKQEAQKVGAKMDQVQKDLASPKVKDKIAKDMAEATKFDFRGTPSFIVNGVPLKGAYPAAEFSRVIDRHLGS